MGALPLSGEGINNRIKLIKRRAYGWRNISNFRNRIVAETLGAGPLTVVDHSSER
ncbi:transposase [Candidatus Poribacteria bacterium]